MNNEHEYVPVSEDTPPIAKGYKNLSRDVLVKTKDNQERTAFLDYNKLQWHDAKTLKIVRDIIAWKDL